MCTSAAVLELHCCVRGTNETRQNCDAHFIEEFTSRVSIMYSCAVTADSRGKSYRDVCPPKSDTDAANLFGVVTHANGQGDETLPRTNETVLIPDPDTPLPRGV